MRRSIVASRAFALLLALSLLGMSGALAQKRDVAGVARLSRHRPLRRQRHHRLPGQGFRRDAAAGGALQGRQADRRTAARGPHHAHRLPHQSRPLDPRSVAQFRDPARQGRIRDARRLRHRRVRRHSVHGSDRRAADPADVGRRLRLSLLRRPQGGGRARNLRGRAGQQEQRRGLCPARGRGGRRHREQDGRRRRDGEGARARRDTSRSTASISTPTRR